MSVLDGYVAGSSGVVPPVVNPPEPDGGGFVDPATRNELEYGKGYAGGRSTGDSASDYDRRLFSESFFSGGSPASSYFSGFPGSDEAWFSDDLRRQLYLNEQQQNFNSLEAEKNRSFQRQMADSEYSRAYNQLRDLGLNPALLLGSGSFSAAVPSGSLASAAGSSVYSGDLLSQTASENHKDRATRIAGVAIGAIITALGMLAKSYFFG